MKLTIDNCVDKYVILCSQLCKTEEDYTKEKVSKHNIAMRKINKLKKSMYANPQLAEGVYGILLKCEDIYIQQTAATDCLLLKIHIDESIKILKRISKCSNRMLSMGAKRTLLIWEGKLNPYDPY